MSLDDLTELYVETAVTLGYSFEDIQVSLETTLDIRREGN